MHVARFEHLGATSYGLVQNGAIAALGSAGDRLPLEPQLPEPEAGASSVPLEGVTLLAPVVRPMQFLGIGVNYRDHAEESGAELPDSPVTFGLLPSAIIGPDAAIELPAFSDQVDWEVELGVVIGKEARNVSVAEAVEHVYGYVIVNDVSARDLQIQEGQWTRAKSLDTFKPIGPWITTTDQLGPADDLEISLSVNGEEMQRSNTSELIFSVPELVSRLSQSLTLLPGSVISTGTPSGVAYGMTPPRYLRAGDSITVEIEGIGSMTNPVVAPVEGSGWAHSGG